MLDREIPLRSSMSSVCCNGIQLTAGHCEAEFAVPVLKRLSPFIMLCGTSLQKRGLSTNLIFWVIAPICHGVGAQGGGWQASPQRSASEVLLSSMFASPKQGTKLGAKVATARGRSEKRQRPEKQPRSWVSIKKSILALKKWGFVVRVGG